MEKQRTLSGVIAFISDDSVLQNAHMKKLLEQRRAEIEKCKKSLTGKESLDVLHELYKTDQLPEYFFDFDYSMNDLLNDQIKDSIFYVRHINYAYQQVLHPAGKGKCSYYVLMPLKIYFVRLRWIFSRPRLAKTSALRLKYKQNIDWPKCACFLALFRLKYNYIMVWPKKGRTHELYNKKFGKCSNPGHKRISCSLSYRAEAGRQDYHA